MKVNEIIGKAKYSLKKHSPEILVVTGVVGVVTSTVLACKATTKIDTILDEHNETMDKIRKQSTDDPEVYSESDKKKDTVIVYSQTSFKFIKLYAPSAILGVFSLGCMLTSNDILRKRSAALGAAYVATDKAFKEYRERVVEKYGEAVDQELRYNIKTEEIEETTTDSKGNEKTKKKKVQIADPNISGYARYFTRSNVNWEDDFDYIDMFLRAQQSYANDLLKVKKHLTLNEVYDMLGFEDSKAGMVVGWVYDTKNPSGDNYIEFSTKKVYLKNEYDEPEEAYIIDFNVDGNIYDKVDA